MTISWATAGQTATSTVHYGIVGESMNSSAQGYSVSYIAPMWHHHVVILDLKLVTNYAYTCGDAVGGFSEQLVFTSAAGYETTSIKVVWNTGSCPCHD